VSGIVVDTSALVAVLRREDGAGWLAEQMASAGERLMAAPAAVELGISLEARAPAATGLGGRALRDADVAVVPFDAELADRALDAWRRLGKGRHRAGLNLGDCFTYALAEQRGYPILCVGDDFARTDLDVLMPPTG
jgi:ribonuclease VapC